jgi:SNF2 family DNA or RNA helicase
MRILHGAWAIELDHPPKGTFFLWGETAEASSEPNANERTKRKTRSADDRTPEEHGRSKRSPRRQKRQQEALAHRFTASADDLLKLAPGLRRFAVESAHCTLLLPSASDGPLPSAPWLRETTPPNATPDLRPWDVQGVRLSAVDVLQLPVLLDELERSAELQLGRDLRFWLNAAELLLECLAQHRFLPWFCRDAKRQLHAVWHPVLDRSDDQKRVSLLIDAMPDACRCLALDGPGTNERPDARAHLTHFLFTVTDAAVRETLSHYQRGLESNWLTALFSTDSVVEGSEARLRLLEKDWKLWSDALRVSAGAAAFRTCFRLEPPDGSEKPGPVVPRGRAWALQFLLQASDDPSLVVPAEQVWSSSARQLKFLKRRFENPQERLLADLGRASRFFAPLGRGLKSARPDRCELDTMEAYSFLREAAPLFEECGYGVLVPSWWDRRAGATGALGLRVQLSPTKDKGRVAGHGLTFRSIVQFDWEVAIGGERLSREEFERLAEMKVPLVQVRGQWVELNTELIEKAIRFLEAKERQGDLSLQEALGLALGRESEAVGLSVVDLDARGWIKEFLTSLRDHEKIEMVPPPAEFRGTLRPYQQRGVSWLSFLHRWGLGACLADDMGTGKTIELLALLLHEKGVGRLNGPSLLICPTSVVGNWQREAERFAPSLKVMVHHGADRLTGEKFADEVAANDLVVTSYSLTHRDAKALSAVEWACVALDEAQNIKNPETKQARSVRQLKAERRVALTGTPVENRLSELWSIMDFLNHGYMGSLAEFKRKFAIPIERYHQPEQTERLKALVQPFVLRRLKTDPRIIRDLPEKMEMKVYCPLTREQATLYQAVVKDMLQQINDATGIKRKGAVLAALMKLKQVCNHPAQFLKDGSALEDRSGKLTRLVEMLDEALAEDDRMLIFTQFAEMGGLLKRHLQHHFGCEALFLHGGVPRTARQKMIDRFQSEDGPPLFVLSLKAGGLGLNLTRANRVFHFDRWWNPAVEEQATDRAFRIGQTRNVHVHKFVCTGTLEEKIDAMIESKRDLARMTIGTGEGWITELSTDQLRDLFALRKEAVEE